MKCLRSAVCVLLSVVFLLGSYNFIFDAVAEKDFFLIIPAVIFIVFATILTYIFLIESFIGYKRFFYENENIIVKRKDRTLAVISKDSIEKLTLVYDVISKKLDGKEDIHYFTFLYNGKRYCVDAKVFGEENLTSLVKGLVYKKTTNNLYYLLSMFR